MLVKVLESYPRRMLTAGCSPERKSMQTPGLELKRWIQGSSGHWALGLSFVPLSFPVCEAELEDLCDHSHHSRGGMLSPDCPPPTQTTSCSNESSLGTIQSAL